MGEIHGVQQAPENVTLGRQGGERSLLQLTRSAVGNHVVQAVLHISRGLDQPRSEVFEAPLVYPGIVFLEGRQPPDLTVISLTRRFDLPLLWSAQEEVLGMR